MIVLVVFWGAVVVLGWTVGGFPATLLALSRLRPRPVRSADITPAVTVVIAAHDEEAVIADKVRNVLALDYPADALQVVVASDGSSDATVSSVRAIGDPRVDVLDLPRTGKAGALQAGVAAARHDVLVFTDANSMFDRGSLRALVRPFADATVGGVAGNQVYLGSASDGAGEQAHWNLDRRLKLAESTVGNVVSATGALYAIRRAHWAGVVDGVTDDFYISTRVVVDGARLVFAPDAIVREPVAASTPDEFARKERVMTRGFASVRARSVLLDPRRHGWYSVQLFTHKVLRRLLALPLLVLATCAPLLWRRHVGYRLLTVAQGAFWALAALGVAAGDRPLARRRPVAIPAFVAMSSWASLRALRNVITGRRIAQWTPQRVVVDPSDTTGRPLDEEAAA